MLSSVRRGTDARRFLYRSMYPPLPLSVLFWEYHHVYVGITKSYAMVYDRMSSIKEVDDILFG